MRGLRRCMFAGVAASLAMAGCRSAVADFYLPLTEGAECAGAEVEEGGRGGTAGRDDAAGGHGGDAGSGGSDDRCPGR